MLLRYFYDEKLAHASYLVGCQAAGEAIVIDPGRNIEPYLDLADRENLKITGATETHIHADFVSGARELAYRTGARLYLSDEGPPEWKSSYASAYDHLLLKDGMRWRIGNVEFQVLHTPGHTPEHISLLLIDTAAASKPMGVFTGDFVFVGDVGRPDLLEEAAGVVGSKEPGARDLFRSLQKFRSLPDYLQIWPAHGAGSACGKALGAVPSSTLGYEKMFNWAFSVQDETDFVGLVLEGQPDPPKYFAEMKRVNKAGPALLNGLPPVLRLDIRRLAGLLHRNAWIVDTRSKPEFAASHVPGTIGIPLSRSFNTYAGWVLPYREPIYLIVDEKNLEEAVTDLIRVGVDEIAGYFSPAALKLLPAYAGTPLQMMKLREVSDVSSEDFAVGPALLDVRARHEFAAGHIPGARNVPLTELLDHLENLPQAEEVLIHCQSGMRSFVAATILQAHGYANVSNLEGGYQAWVEAGLPVEK